MISKDNIRIQTTISRELEKKLSQEAKKKEITRSELVKEILENQYKIKD